MLRRCSDRARATCIQVLRRQFCKQKESPDSPGPLPGPGHDHVAKREYAFMESADILFQESKQAAWHHRWDWHAWQVLAALVPSLCIYSVAMYARGEMRRLTKELDEEAHAREKAEHDVKQRQEEQRNAEEREMRDRIQVLEAQMKEMTAQRATSARSRASEHPNGHAAQPAQQGKATCSDAGGPKSPPP